MITFNMSQLVYKTTFILLILSLFSAKIEVSFSMAVISVFISYSSKVNIKLLNVLTPILLLFLVGLLRVLNPANSIEVLSKDIVYFMRPILIIFGSYFLIRKIHDKQFLFSSIIVLGFIFAIYHLIKTIININYIESIVKMRIIGGRYNHVELIALCFIILINNLKIKKQLGNIWYNFLTIILVISFILYFSRVMFVVLILFYLAYKGYLELTRKGVKTILFGVLFVSFFMIVINQFKVDSNSLGIGAFVFKIQNTYNEVFDTLDIEKIKKDKRELWKHWRGFEAQSAIETLNSNGILSWTYGEGFGASVDLGLEVKLANEEVRYIPILHNGFVYVLFKTGLLGLFLYLIYIYNLYQFYKVNSNSKNEFVINRLIVGCAFYIILSSLVVTGIFKPYDLSSLLIGSLFALKNYQNENSYTRN